MAGRQGAGTTVDAGGAGQLSWVHEDDPRWDRDRDRVFASVAEDVFPTLARRPGEQLTSDWWRVERDGRVVGYGWLDDVWGDAEVLLAVDGAERRTGVGEFVLARLEQEAAARGLNYVVNVVRDAHPEKDAVTTWLHGRGYAAAEDGRLHKRVGATDPGQRQDGRPGAGRPREPDGPRRERYTAERDRAAARPHGPDGPDREPLGPGAEESGGYVYVELHRF
jgi:N-acetylglutamate synthase-like GNAT family acetyltransferase